MELGGPRREVVQNLKRRTEVPELSNFVLALTRLKRRQWAWEKAANLPVKILFPLVLFIFPPLSVVVLGSAASSISGTL